LRISQKAPDFFHPRPLAGEDEKRKKIVSVNTHIESQFRVGFVIFHHNIKNALDYGDMYLFVTIANENIHD